MNAHNNERTLIGSIPVKQPAYMHTFSMTKHYIILPEYPLKLTSVRDKPNRPLLRALRARNNGLFRVPRVARHSKKPLTRTEVKLNCLSLMLSGKPYIENY